MQQQQENDPHSFRLLGHTPLDNTERITEPKSATLTEALEREEIIAEAFARDGFFVLRQCFDKNVLLPFHDFGNAYFDLCFRDLYDHGHAEVPCYRSRDAKTLDNAEDDTDANRQRCTYTLQQGIKHGFREIVMRSPGRYELSLLHFDRKHNNADQKNNNETLFHAYRLDEKIPHLIEPLTSLLPRLVGPNYTTYEQLKLCHFSLLIATPGSSDQSWHADGGHMSVSKHLPCHCFNVFFPLQDTPKVLGPTELRPASQFLTRNLGPMMLAAKCRKTLMPPVWPEISFGDAIVLDYRVLHRGRANLSDDSANTVNHNASIDIDKDNKKLLPMNRNYLVLSYSEPWFEDVLNFPKRSMYDTK
jgi:hypothetical protein